MTDRELMQHALDAMLNNPDDISDEMLESIKALKERLAQVNEFEPDWDAMAVMVEEQQRMAKRIEELEAQQKPWVKSYAGGKPNYTTPEEPGVKLDASAPIVVQPHPAFKKWQGLTDEEIAEMHNEIKVRLMGTYRTEDIYRAIEDKLKEKNA